MQKTVYDDLCFKEKSYLCSVPNMMNMTTKNIFAGVGVRTTFVNILYDELMKREFVTLADVMCIKRGKPKGFYDNNPKATLSSEMYYGDLKKASSEVVKALELDCPGCIEDNGKTGKGKAFRYVGDSDDPLAAERQSIEQKRIEDYVAFCKASAGILPTSWFSSYFENTQLLLDTNREAESGASHIRSSLEQILTNIDLLPVFNKAITDRQVLRFSYQPFGQDEFELTFHPQFLKEYNGRWFVFGEANREPYQAYNVPLDRIVGEVCPVEGIEYIPAVKGFYQQYFKDIIGVTHEKDAKVEQVVIRTKSEYQHGLLMTKPLHHSLVETLPFGEHDGQRYGEVRLTIEPNRELRGRILMYGENLEVMQPLQLREQIKEILTKQLENYNDIKE
jgi:hypothetical protein